VSGAITPYQGASLIWRKALWQVGAPDELAAFVGLASEWEEYPTSREAIDAQITQQARNLITHS
jgi:hypothetical protein